MIFYQRQRGCLHNFLSSCLSSNISDIPLMVSVSLDLIPPFSPFQGCTYNIFSQPHCLQVLLLSLVPLSAAFYLPRFPHQFIFLYSSDPPCCFSERDDILPFSFQRMQLPVTGLKGLKLERKQICKQAAMRCKCLMQVSFKSSMFEKATLVFNCPNKYCLKLPLLSVFQGHPSIKTPQHTLGKVKKKFIFKLIYQGFLLRGNAAANWKTLSDSLGVKRSQETRE